MEPLKYFCICHGTPINKNTRITCKNIKVLDTSTNKPVIAKKLKNQKFNDSVVLAYLECICYFQDLAKKRILNMYRPIF